MLNGHPETSLAADFSIAASSAAPAALTTVGETASHYGWKIAMSLAAAGAAFAVVKTLVRLLDFIGERGARYRAFKKAIPLVRVVIWSTAIYMVVRYVYAPTHEALWAFLTASGVAIGFASQDILKNVFGGLVIILDRPFQVGDKIKVGDDYGEVVGMGLRTVRIVTPEDSKVTIPNAEIVAKAVANANSGELNCQVAVEVTLPDSADLETAKRVAWEAAATSRYVYLKKPIVVLVKDAPYERGLRVRLKIKAYVLDPRYEFQLASDVTDAVLARLRRSGSPS